MIYALALAPRLAQYETVRPLRPGQSHHSLHSVQAPLHSSFEFCRCLQTLGMPSCALFCSDAIHGQSLERLLEAEKINYQTLQCEAAVTLSTIIKGEADEPDTIIHSAPPALDLSPSMDKLLEKLIQPGDCVALCGALPGHYSRYTYALLGERVCAQGGHLLVLDAPTELLGPALSRRPLLASFGARALRELADAPLPNEEEVLAFCYGLSRSGASTVLLPHEGPFAYAVTGGRALRAEWPQSARRSPVELEEGAFMAGYLYAVQQGHAAPECFAMALATAGARAAAASWDGVERSSIAARLTAANIQQMELPHC